MNIKYSIEGLARKPLFTLLTIIQLVISLVLIYFIISSNAYVKDKLNKVDDLFPKDNYYVVDRSKAIELEDMDYEKLRDFYIKIEENEKINIYSIDETSVFVSMDDILEDSVSEFDIIEVENQDFNRVEAFKINEAYVDDIGIDLFEGNYVVEEEGVVPIIGGYNYSKSFSINDEIEYAFLNSEGIREIDKMKITGFLKKDSFLCEEGDPNNLINVDDYIIIPFSLKNQIELLDLDNELQAMMSKIDIHNYLTLGYYSFDNEEDILTLEEESSEFGLNIKFVSMEDSIKSFKDNIEADTYPIQLLTICILIFTIISLIMVMLSYVIKSIPEYATHILLGATTQNIALRIFYEIGLMFLVSTIVSLSIVNLLFSNDEILHMTLGKSVELVLISVLICIFVSLIPIGKFNKYSINDILRRSE